MPLEEIAIDVKEVESWDKKERQRLLLILDLGSRYLEAIPIDKQETAEMIKDLLFRHWISRFGAPEVVHMDPNGAHVSHEFLEFLNYDGLSIKGHGRIGFVPIADYTEALKLLRLYRDPFFSKAPAFGPEFSGGDFILVQTFGAILFFNFPFNW